MGDCLGNGDYEVFLADGAYGGFEVTDLGKYQTSLDWEWVLNDMGTATLVARYPYDCCLRENPIWPAYTQLWVRRDGTTLHKGFVREVTFRRDRNEGYNELTISSADWSYYLSHRKFDRNFQYVNTSLTAIYKDYVDYAFADGSPSDITFVVNDIGVYGDRLVNAIDEKLIRPEIDDLAKAGVDWVVIADTWFIGGFVAGGQAAILDYEFSEESFLEPAQLRRTADEYGTRVTSRANNDIRGVYGGKDPLGMIWDIVDDAQTTIQSQTEADSAAKSQWDRVHIPLPYLEGDGVLNPKIPIDITDLVPGIEVRNIHTLDCEAFDKVQRLERVKVSVDQERNEKITVVFQPVGTGSSLGSVADA